MSRVICHYCRSNRSAKGRFFFGHNNYPQRRKPTKKNTRNDSDSIWAIILGSAKNLNVTHDYVLNEMTFENMMMYSSATPAYGDNKEAKKTKFDESLDANNPNNFNNNEDEEE